MLFAVANQADSRIGLSVIPKSSGILMPAKTLAPTRFLCYTIHMRYDYKILYQKNYDFYTHRPTALRVLKAANLLCTALFFLAYAATVLLKIASIYAGNTDYEALIRLLLSPAACLLIVSVLRPAVNRPRPYSERGAGITPLLRKHGNADKSFPSRHLACAFVIAIGVLPFYPILGWLLLPFACALGYIRFALGLHYPSDLIAGALLGTACGLLAL